jgi:cysteinyl-tRNA synthetase
VETGLETFHRFFQRYRRVTGEDFHAITPATRRSQGDFDPAGDPLLTEVAERRDRFLESMDDDFNTGGAIGDLFELVRRLNKFVDDEKLEEPGRRDAARIAFLRRGAAVLRELSATLGLFGKPAEAKLAAGDELTGRLMTLLIELRAEARKRKDFATADRIRDGLLEIGVTLEDRPGGTEWRRG